MKYSGILHVHSRYSYDGKLTLSEIKSLCLDRGVHFVCMTEHTDELTASEANAYVEECRSLSDKDFVFVPGFEVPYQNTHVLQFGSTQFLSQFADVEILKKWSEEAALTVLAHPVRNNFIIDEELASVLDGVEIWNQQYDGKHVPRTRAVKMYLDVRKSRPKLLSTSGVDFHRLEHFGSPYTFIDISELTELAIIRALQKGDFSFGKKHMSIAAGSSWTPNMTQRVQSLALCFVIQAGKSVNKIMALTGIGLPKFLRRWIRKLV